MKKLIIKDPIPFEKPQQGFYLSITFMHGDADGYTTEKFGPFLDNEQDALLNLVDVLEAQMSTNNKMNAEDSFDKIPGLYQWFEPESFEDEDAFVENFGEELYSKEIAKIKNIEDIIDRTDLCWVNNPDGYGDKASIDYFWINYIDTSGIEHFVEIEK